MTAPKNPILLAVIGAAHGIKGELRVKTFTGDPLALAGYGPLYAKDGRDFEIIAIRNANTVVIVRFKDIDRREQAEALNGIELYVDRDALQAGDEDEFLHADLIGLTVRDENGLAIGRVTAVQNFGGGDILELAISGQKGVLIPFTRAAVPEVDLDQGFVCIDSVAAGLVDDEDGGEMPDGFTEPDEAAATSTPAARPGRVVQNPVGETRGRINLQARPRGPKDAGGNR